MSSPATVTSPGNAAVPSGGVKVSRIMPGTIAEQLGLLPGDTVLSFNKNQLNDVIDYWFHSAAERLKITWIEAATGEVRSKTIRKAYHERLGFEVEPFEIKRCTNYCVFCFVHQLPTGMRRELYVKDEDYRLSFLYGNYITGTNLSDEDKDRIVRLKLSPIYFSIHATDQEVREKLLAKKNIEPIVPLLRWLTDRGIYVHGQIVLCPGINDGKVLEQTVMDLAPLYPRLESLAVVPLGLTAHRSRLPTLQDVTPAYARRFVDECAGLQQKIKKKFGYPLIFPSDEFFLIGEMIPPSYDEYPEIPQLANGVGMYYRMYQHLDELMEALPERLPTARRVAAITTHMGVRVLQRLVDAANSRVSNLEITLLPTTNTLFGEGITVTGLLPGADFKRMIDENPGYDRYLVPENSLRSWDRRFLDDLLFDELVEQTGVEIVTGKDTAESFLEAALR